MSSKKRFKNEGTVSLSLKVASGYSQRVGSLRFIASRTDCVEAIQRGVATPTHGSWSKSTKVKQCLQLPQGGNIVKMDERCRAGSAVVVFLVALVLSLFPAACVIPTPAELEAGAATTEEEPVPEAAPAEPEPVEEVDDPEPDGPPLFEAQKLVDLKDANPVRFNRDWDGKEVRVVGILADIDFAGPGWIRLKVNASGIQYIIGVECTLERSEAADAAVADIDIGVNIRVAGMVVARDDWMVELKPCGVVEVGPAPEASS